MHSIRSTHNNKSCEMRPNRDWEGRRGDVNILFIILTILIIIFQFGNAPTINIPLLHFQSQLGLIKALPARAETDKRCPDKTSGDITSPVDKTSGGTICPEGQNIPPVKARIDQITSVLALHIQRPVIALAN